MLQHNLHYITYPEFTRTISGVIWAANIFSTEYLNLPISSEILNYQNSEWSLVQSSKMKYQEVLENNSSFDFYKVTF